jgi:hypothetical protein
MIAQTYVRFPAPITLDLRLATEGEGEEHPPQLAEFAELPLILHLDAVARTITAHLPPVPGRLQIYGPGDFVAACPDEPEDHAARVLQCLGSAPAATLQALLNGIQPPLPPRIPREIPNWRAKAILATMGLLDPIAAAIATMPEPERTIASLAWHGDAKLARRGKTVLSLAAALGLSDEQVDALFIAAEALEV